MNNIKQHQIYFFILIGCILFFNIVGKLVPFNHEPLFVILFLYGIFIAMKNRKYVIDYRILIWAGLLLLYWVIAVVVLNLHGELGNRSLSHLNITYSFLAFFMASILVIYLKPNIDFFWYLIGIAAISSSLLLVLEIQAIGWEQFIDGKRLGRAYSHPIKMGVFANTIFIIMLGSLIWAYQKKKVFFIIWILLLVTVFCAVVFSQTRQAWIGWPEAIIAWGLYYFWLFKKTKKISAYKILLSAGFMLTTIVLFVLFTPIKGVFEERVSSVYVDVNSYFNHDSFRSSIGERLLSYDAALSGISNNFWLGIGEERFREFQTTETSKIAFEKFNIKFTGLDYRHIHNQYLMSFLTKGVFGLLSLIFLLMFLFWFFINGLRKASMEHKPIWIAGLVFTTAETLIFIPDSPLIRSDTAANFLLYANLMIGFAILSEKKASCDAADSE